MKKLNLFFSVIVTGLFSAQTTIYSENFGAGDTTTQPTASAYTGYQNTNITYSGNADIRLTTPSTGYTGASGGGLVFIGGTTAAPEKFILIEGINTVDYIDLALSLGQQKGTNVSSNELQVAVSDDGITWIPLTYTRASGPGTSTWTLITPTGAIPATATLKIKISNPLASNVGFRIDDIKLVGTKVLATNDIKKSQFTVYPTLVSNGIINIVSENNTSKMVKIYDMNAKLVLSTETHKEVNVQNLPKGNYVISIEQNGKKDSKKIIIK